VSAEHDTPWTDHDCPWRRAYEQLDAGRPPVPEHGTRARYCRGCRCPDCRAANAAYDRALRRRPSNTVKLTVRSAQSGLA
jgi:hypothetical protein